MGCCMMCSFLCSRLALAEGSDAPDRQGEVKKNRRPEADAGQPQAQARVDEHRNRRRVVEQHRGDQSSRGAAPGIVARQPAGEAQRQQGGPGDARQDRPDCGIKRARRLAAIPAAQVTL